jgi:hypothetical protein
LAIDRSENSNDYEHEFPPFFYCGSFRGIVTGELRMNDSVILSVISFWVSIFNTVGDCSFILLGLKVAEPVVH